MFTIPLRFLFGITPPDRFEYPYIAIQRSFQLYSKIYRPFAPGSLPLDSFENPLGVCAEVLASFAPDLSEDLLNNTTKFGDVGYLKNSHNDWIVYGDYTERGLTNDPGLEHLFIAMYGLRDDEHESAVYCTPYFILDFIYTSNNNTLMLCQNFIGILGNMEGISQNDLIIDCPETFSENVEVRYLADLVLLQIIGNQPVDMDANRQQLEKASPNEVARHLNEAARSRTPHFLLQHHGKQGSTGAAGFALK